MIQITKLLIPLLFFIMSTDMISAKETCSRVATINFQKVLVDTNSTQKGEGLRYHLEKDPIAKSYLDRYQQGTRIRWSNAIIGTTGSALLIASVLSNSGRDKDALLIGGVSLMAVNFLVARTVEYNNENNLLKAVEEYNKRNLPRIYFNPFEEEQGKKSKNFVIEFFKDF